MAVRGFAPSSCWVSMYQRTPHLASAQAFTFFKRLATSQQLFFLPQEWRLRGTSYHLLWRVQEPWLWVGCFVLKANHSFKTLMAPGPDSLANLLWMTSLSLHLFVRRSTQNYFSSEKKRGSLLRHGTSSGCSRHSSPQPVIILISLILQRYLTARNLAEVKFFGKSLDSPLWDPKVPAPPLMKASVLMPDEATLKLLSCSRSQATWGTLLVLFHSCWRLFMVIGCCTDNSYIALCFLQAVLRREDGSESRAISCGASRALNFANFNLKFGKYLLHVYT